MTAPLPSTIFRTRSLANCVEDLGSASERMIQITMLSYPNDWSDQDKRELAQQHLFGRKEEL